MNLIKYDIKFSIAVKIILLYHQRIESEIENVICAHMPSCQCKNVEQKSRNKCFPAKRLQMCINWAAPNEKFNGCTKF